MVEKLMEDLKEFLNDANLSTYEISAFITLLYSSSTNPPTAKEISTESNVPSGRIYEVLEELNTKGLVEIIESRPKKYKALTLNKALDNLIYFQNRETKRKIGYLYDRAKIIEREVYNSDLLVRKEPSKIFWSTSYGSQSILSSYVKYINEANEEIIFTEFINDSTIKILPFAEMIYGPLKKAIERGVRVKEMWCFEFDNRPLTDEQIEKSKTQFKEIKEAHENLFGLSNELAGFEIKYIFQRLPTYFDIFDRKQISFKLQNPLKPFQIFASMKVIDLNLAEELRNKFLSLWTFEAMM